MSGASRIGWAPYMLGVGYARTIAAHDLVGPLQGTIGTELVAGFRHTVYAPRDAGAISLTAPVGLSLGDPATTSLGFYAAPYVQSGIMRAWETVPGSCTPWCQSRLTDTGLRSAAGVGLGGRAAIGRSRPDTSTGSITVHPEVNRRICCNAKADPSVTRCARSLRMTT